MSAASPGGSEWLEPSFWEWLDRLEGRHQHSQCEHERARGVLERLTHGEREPLQEAWQRYRQVIRELEETSAEFAALRAC